MGGGDLNLKKSWHPSTMKNMEKVWKAEQKHEQEKKKIAELQREIREEREREEIRKFAEDGGVVEKKDEFKLDWMYKGPGGIVSREDYLLGRAIDKSFDLLQEAEKEGTGTSSTEGNSRVLPGRSGIIGEQVDMARKLQEDPLLLIKKKEMETRSQILNNPVKLKQLQKYLKGEKAKESKKSKKKKKKRRRRSSSSSSTGEKDLDQILAAKYNRLRDKLNNVEMSRLLMGEEDGDRKRRRGETEHEEHHCGTSREESKSFHKGYGLQKPAGYEQKPQLESCKQSRNDREKSKKTSQESVKRTNAFSRTTANKRPLSREELERRRKEMMDNAKWREKQREHNVLTHREEEKQEKKVSDKQQFDPTFLRKQLSIAASVGSVEGRIKSNINNIQRSGGAMDRNFAKR